MPNDETIVTPPAGDNDAGTGADATGDAGTGDQGDQGEAVDWKARAEEEQGRRERAESKLEKLKSKPADAPAPSKSSELDYGQLAFYNTKSGVTKIESTEEVDFLTKTMQETGKSQSELLEAKWFQSELKELKDAKTIEGAIPDGSKRSNQSASSTVEYWLGKGELPPNTPENRELRQQVVNARMKSEQAKNQFTDNPVVR